MKNRKYTFEQEIKKLSGEELIVLKNNTIIKLNLIDKEITKRILNSDGKQKAK